MRLIAVILLLVLWFAAREHCNLEAAGLISDQCAQDCGVADGCDAAEKSFYKNSVGDVRVAAPLLQVCLILTLPPPELNLRPSSSLNPELHAEQRALNRTWQFVERAAPPCRAPSLIA